MDLFGNPLLGASHGLSSWEAGDQAGADLPSLPVRHVLSRLHGVVESENCGEVDIRSQWLNVKHSQGDTVGYHDLSSCTQPQLVEMEGQEGEDRWIG